MCFFSNTDSLGHQSFKGASWALVLGLPLRDIIKSLSLVLGPFLIPTFGFISWVCAPIISNPISICFKILKFASITCSKYEKVVFFLLIYSFIFMSRLKRDKASLIF